MRKDLHLGQTVRFMDWRDGQMRPGKVVAMKDTQVTIHEDGTRTSWTLPYAAIEPPVPGRQAGEHARAAVNRQGPAATTSAAARRSRSKTSTSTPWWAPSCASTSAPPPSTPATEPSWRVGFALLRHVVDI